MVIFGSGGFGCFGVASLAIVQRVLLCLCVCVRERDLSCAAHDFLRVVLCVGCVYVSVLCANPSPSRPQSPIMIHIHNPATAQNKQSHLGCVVVRDGVRWCVMLFASV